MHAPASPRSGRRISASHAQRKGTRLHDRQHLVTDERLDRVDALTKLAERLGRSLLDLAIAGLAARPATGSVIAGATKPEQVKANAAAGAWVPDEQALAELDKIAPRPS